jgi:hypothetical protein
MARQFTKPGFLVLKDPDLKSYNLYLVSANILTVKYILIISLLFGISSSAQNTIALEANLPSPRATLEDVSWIAGHWMGEAFGGITEEIWSPPLGGSMMFVFKLVSDGKVQFYEIGHILEVDETLLLQLKHFHGNLKGWEEKGDTVDFRLVKIDGDRIYFDQFTLEKISGEEMNIYVVIGENKKAGKEVKFNYKKQ